jgi:hypothetical protein
MLDDAAPTGTMELGPRSQAEDGASERWEKVRETAALVLLSVTAILTAWCGFEASKWGGEMSIAFSRASAARIEAAKQQGIANNARQQDLTVYGLYTQAEAEGNEELSRYVRTRFSGQFKVAFDAWNVSGRTNGSPFDVPEYVPPGTNEAQAADQRADRLFAQGLVNNQRGDNYTLLTVLAALVLFFAATSGRLSRPQLRWAGLIFAGLLFVAGAVVVFTSPVVI